MNIAHLEIGQASVPIVSSAVRNPGAWFHVNLKMTEQINKTCQSVYHHLHNIGQVRRSLTPVSTKLLVQAGIDYCNGLLYGAPAVHLSKLQRLQNSAARLITQTPRYCHITPVLLALHWLPMKFRICYKIAMISFKAIHNIEPAYLSNLINIKQCSRYNLRSNVGVILQDPTAKFRCTLGDRSFTAVAPKICNSLPDYIRKESDAGGAVVFMRGQRSNLAIYPECEYFL